MNDFNLQHSYFVFLISLHLCEGMNVYQVSRKACNTALFALGSIGSHHTIPYDKKSDNETHFSLFTSSKGQCLSDKLLVPLYLLEPVQNFS